MDPRSSSTLVDSNGNIDVSKIEKETNVVKPELKSATIYEIKTQDISSKGDTSLDAENNNETPIKIVSDVDKLAVALEQATLAPSSKVSGSPRSISEIMVKLYFPKLVFGA